MDLFKTQLTKARVSAFIINFYIVLPALYQAADPLLLTPYIERGDIETARKLSEVRDPSWFFKTIPDSYAGFITVDKTLGNHLFFWFFPSTSDPKAPLLIWLNGGPSVSSMFGLFWENGPLKAKGDHSIFEDPYERREHSWADPFSMLYIDNPVGTGFSYTENEDKGYRVTQDGYTEDLYSFVEQFYKLFPEYHERELYIGGQSYAGKYVTALAYRIHTQLQTHRSSIPLTGIYLGGPYFDPPTESVAFCDFLYNVGAVSNAQMVAHKEKATRINKLVLQGKLHNRTVSSLFDELIPEIGLFSNDNYVTGQGGDYNIVFAIMNSRTILRAVHAGNLFFRVFNDAVYDMFGQDLLVSLKPQMAELLNKYKVLIYTGDYDVIVSSVMVEAALLSTPWEFQEQYNNSQKTIWATDRSLRGFYSLTSNFCRVVVHGAGHQTPHDQPEITLDMMKQFVKYGCIQF